MKPVKQVRTVFMGSDPIALPFLHTLERTVPAMRLCAIFTQPDRPKGRGQKLQPNAIKQWALEQGLPVRQPERCGRADEAWLDEEKIDLVLVMAYGQMLKPGFLQRPLLGVYNLHTSLLPKFRGASPIHTALVEGEETTGVTFMRVIPQMDAGPIIDQQPVAINAAMTAPDLIDALAQACVPLIERALPMVLSGTAIPKEQDLNAVIFCRRIFKEDAALDFRAPAALLDRRIRGFQPWPGSIFTIRGTPLRVGSATIVDSPGGDPGRIHRPSADTLIVSCGTQALQLHHLQRPGGRMLPTSEFLRGFPLEPSDRIAEESMAPLTARRPFPWKWRPGDSTEAIFTP